MTFSDAAQKRVAPLWQESLEHPFIQELSDGSLPSDVFQYYLIQDHHYLRDFARLHELTAAQCHDEHVKTLLLGLAADLRAGEMTTRATFFKTLGISDEMVAQTPLAPTTYAYTSHMYRTLTEQGPAAAVAGLLPCAWLYADIGHHLEGVQSPVPIYQAWVASYQAADYTNSVSKQRLSTDQLAMTVSEQDREQMMAAFGRSTFYEAAFWQMALTKEQWLDTNKVSQ